MSALPESILQAVSDSQSPRQSRSESRIQGHDLATSWVDFLGRWDWQWFTTHTFPDIVHPEQADKAFRVWASMINRQMYGPRWYKKGKAIRWARALEYQKRGVIHFHALVDGVQGLRRLSWMDRWYEVTGGYARIEQIKSFGAVAAYCAKYVTKDGEIELSKSLCDGWQMQGQVIPQQSGDHKE